MIASRQQRKKVSLSGIHIGGLCVSATASTRNLGVFFDQSLDMDAQVTAICKAAYFHLRNINSVRKSLSQKDAAALIHAFVTSRLDNGNSLLVGMSSASLDKLQRVQNAAARCILGIRKFDHITPALKQLHWLPCTIAIVEVN